MSRDTPDSPAGTPIKVVLWVIIAVAALVIAGTLGWLVRGSGSSGSAAAPSSTSVDAGFARDMSTHHVQAVTMAGYERDNTANSALKVLATDIETSQQFQVGQMSGWLDSWNLSRNSTNPMAWMGHQHMHIGPNGLMPGMATPAQMNRLESLHGAALDKLFLQLMIHHHQGGVAMANYAEQHASEPYVRTLAGHIAADQTAQIIEMERMLRSLGGAPLPPPQ